MIPAKIEPILITTISNKGVESIVDWFDQHKKAFYTLGWSYLQNQQQIEELFYRSILKVHKEFPRFKRETSFETWVTSIFIHTCRELSNDRGLQVSKESEPRQDLFHSLDQLIEYEKEAMVLTYVKGLPHEEAAQLLQVSVEKMKELLFTGIRSLRKEMGYGSSFNGCKEHQKDYIDYLERNLDRSKKIDLEIHIYHCPDCQDDLASFQDVILTMSNLSDRMEENFHVPMDFMKNVKAKLAVKEKHRQQQNKKRLRMGMVFASFFALLIGIEVFTGAFTKLYYSWTEEDQELRAILQQDLGERLNLEAESDGVKIKIRSAVADEVQTLVFYEIEDTNEENQYVMNYDDGVSVKNQYEIMNTETHPRYYPPDLTSDKNNKEKNVYQGKISLLPLKKDKATIKLTITKLLKLTRDSSDNNSFMVYENMEYGGDWNFEIPVTKKPSVEYALNKKTEVEGVLVRFDKLTVAPTATILQYSINNEQSKKRIDVLNFDKVKVNNKVVKNDLYGSAFVDSQQDMNWTSFQTHFDPLFGEKPKEVNIQLQSMNLTFEDPKTIELAPTKQYPQTFEYAGSTISIDKVEVGLPSIVVISNHDIKSRAYEALNFSVLGGDETEPISMEMDTEGVLVDRNGMEYDQNNLPVSYEELEQPRHFITVQNFRIDGNNNGEAVIPKRLEIYGYSTTKYLDDVVKITLD